MSLYKHENWGSIQSHIFAKGIITAVDAEYDLADVTVAGYRDGSDVPLFYHCSDDAEERSNGAVEGAASAFSAGSEDDPEDGDEVIVMCKADTGEPVRIIGFVEGVKRCCIFTETLIGDYAWSEMIDATRTLHGCFTYPTHVEDPGAKAVSLDVVYGSGGSPGGFNFSFEGSGIINRGLSGQPPPDNYVYYNGGWLGAVAVELVDGFEVHAASDLADGYVTFTMIDFEASVSNCDYEECVWLYIYITIMGHYKEHGVESDEITHDQDMTLTTAVVPSDVTEETVFSALCEMEGMAHVIHDGATYDLVSWEFTKIRFEYYMRFSSICGGFSPTPITTSITSKIEGPITICANPPSGATMLEDFW